MKTFKQLIKEYNEIINEASQQRLGRIMKSLLSTEKSISKMTGSEGIKDISKFKSENPFHPLTLRHDSLSQVWADAKQKDVKRLMNIATKVKETEPEEYKRLASIAKPIALKGNEEKINLASSRLERLRAMNAPKELISIAQTSLDNASDVGGRIHQNIGALTRAEKRKY